MKLMTLFTVIFLYPSFSFSQISEEQFNTTLSQKDTLAMSERQYKRYKKKKAKALKQSQEITWTRLFNTYTS